jgi:exonuclease VII small subunit
MNQAQLKNDLTEIERGVDRADMPESMKRVLRDMLEWSRGLVDQAGTESKATVERLDVIEDAVDELLNGSEEAISMETAKVIITALEQARILCTTLIGALEKGSAALDDLTRERFVKLAKTCQLSIATAEQVTQELVMPEDDPDAVETVPNTPASAGEESEDDEVEEDEGDEDDGDEDEDEGEADNG